MNTNILLVDDNQDLLKITQIILKGQGYHVDIATNVEEATEKIETLHPHVLLLDVNICNEDGRAFCNQLKQQKATTNIKIILMSGNDYTKDEWNGADDFLQKPFEYTDLLHKVDGQLQAAVMVA